MLEGILRDKKNFHLKFYYDSFVSLRKSWKIFTYGKKTNNIHLEVVLM